MFLYINVFDIFHHTKRLGREYGALRKCIINDRPQGKYFLILPGYIATMIFYYKTYLLNFNKFKMIKSK